MSDENEKEFTEFGDLTFDFEDYFRRYDSGEMSQVERQEWAARIIGIFVREVLHNRQPPGFATLYIAKQFHQVLHGDELAEKFRLPKPWAQFKDPRPKSELKRIESYIAVLEEIKAAPNRPITESIKAAAEKMCDSYETVRGYWYSMVKRVGTPKSVESPLSKEDGK